MKHETDIQIFIRFLESIDANFNMEVAKVYSHGEVKVILWDSTFYLFDLNGKYKLKKQKP